MKRRVPVKTAMVGLLVAPVAAMAQPSEAQAPAARLIPKAASRPIHPITEGRNAGSNVALSTFGTRFLTHVRRMRPFRRKAQKNPRPEGVGRRVL